MKIQGISYIGTKDIDKPVRIVSGYPSSHFAFMFEDGTVADARLKGFNRYRLHDQENCVAEIYDILISDEQMQKLADEIAKECGKHGYDFNGIIGYAIAKCWGLGWFYHSNRKWFCSEAGVILLRRVGAILFEGYRPQEISPGKLVTAPVFRKVMTVRIVNYRILGIIETFT